MENYKVGSVVALKAARVSDYGGKSLNSGDGLYIEPDHKRTPQLKKWFEKNQDKQFNSISIQN